MTEKPQAKPVDVGYLPDKLCNTALFCNWRYEMHDDRWTKVPYNPRTGRHGSSTDPDAFADLDTAIAAESKHDGIGVGLFGNLAAIDIDHCIDESGELSDLAKDIVETMDAYTERSPSGTGLRILCTVPEGFSYDADKEYYTNNRKNGVEVYVAGITKGRFVTVTGDALSDNRDLDERGEQLAVILDKYMQKPKRDEGPRSNVQPVTDAQKYTDEEVYNELLSNETTAALFMGDFSRYDSQSEADLALCGILASWTCRDPERIDKLFRMSGLYRDKWERADYRKRTIDEAISGCKYIHVKGDQPEPPADSPASVLKGINIGKYLETGGMESDIDYFKPYRFRKTGFPCLDEHLTLYPGLAAVGGAPSIGKSTFCVCMADNLVMDRETVMFFSLEQSPVELVTKSLARRLAERCPEYLDHPTAYLDNVKIKNGCKNDELDKVKREYAADVKDLFYIIPCDFRTTAADIQKTVEAFIRERGVKPIVFIDYLQLVSPPENFKGDQRAAIDHNIKLFKAMQLANDLLVILVSNFNRSGYNSPVTYADFKETGMIEFTCDYIWGLQLSVLSENKFYYRIGSQGGKSYTTEIEKDEMIDDAMKAYPKKVQFVSLKNRNGRQRFRGNFDYFNDFDYFRDSEAKNPFDDEDVTVHDRI